MTIFTRSGYANPGTSLAFKTGTWRVQRPLHQHRAAPCHAVCPAGEDAQAWLARLEEGSPRAAWETIVAVNPLPAVTGRVCHHPCEGACNRGQFDQPIAIHGVERYLGDLAIEHDWAYPVTPPATDAAKVAVVGAGPAGLSAAYHLTRLGHRVTLFDALPEAGGTLRTALPAYRLPREVLNREIERLLATGIDFRPHHLLGRDISLEELRDDYGAVFLGPGRQMSREWSVEGATPKDLQSGIDMLREWVAVGEVPNPRSVVIIGGGNTAVDLSRILRRGGVPEVHVVTHQSLPGNQDEGNGDLMTAIPREIRQAQEEGVRFHDHRGIRRLILRGERVVGVEMVRMKKLDKGGGRLERVAFEGTETVLHVDQVIPAIGQEVDPEGMDWLLHPRGVFDVDTGGRVEGAPGIYAGGDARAGSIGMVSSAIGDGRRAAAAIDRQLRGQPPYEEAKPEAIPFAGLNLNYYEHRPRPEEPVLPVEARKGDAEIEGGLSSGDAQGEARRCFSCGNCFACDNCWTLCPDSAVLKTKELASDGSHYLFDYDYCKGCGLCAHECPCGYIAMEDEL